MKISGKLYFMVISVVFLVFTATGTARADTAAQLLPFSQDWSNTGLIVADDNWSGVPGITGYRGDNLTLSTGVDPQTVLADDTPGVIDVNANQTNPNTFTTGGVIEFHLANPVVALNGSNTADAPYLLIHLNTTGRHNITVSYTLRDLDGSTDNAVQPVALHYRVGNSGTFTNVAAAFVADATTGPSLATLVTPVSVTLPSDADDQPLVQLRIMTSNAAGNDEAVGVDDIVVYDPSCQQTVTNADDSGAGSLRQAIADVCTGGTITFGGDYLITLGSELAIGRDMTIEGTGHTVTVSGGNAVRVFSVSGAVVTLKDLAVTNGFCSGDFCGGGILNTGGTLTVSGCVLSGNVTSNISGSGGGMVNDGGTALVQNSTLSGNSAADNGGAIANRNGTMTVFNSTFVGNAASGGGGISNNNGTLAMSNVTLIGNYGYALGGGILNSSGTLTLINSTLSGNADNSLTGTDIFNTGTLSFTNNILANAVAGANCYNSGTISINQNNLVEDGSCSAALSGDPQLGQLADYGGATQTLALLPGSPAVDAGDAGACPGTDQRGVIRPQGGGCDIGAFESRGFTLSLYSGDNQRTPVNSPFVSPLGVMVNESGGSLLPGALVTFTAPSSGASLSVANLDATCNSSGLAAPTVTANGSVGSFIVTASSAGAGNTVDFSLQNLADGDGDAIADVNDNCPAVSNADQADADRDGTGDVCETFTVTPFSGPGGRIDPNSAVDVPYNGTTSFVIVPAAGFGIGSAAGCDGSLNGTKFTTGNITADCSVTATFNSKSPQPGFISIYPQSLSVTGYILVRWGAPNFIGGTYELQRSDNGGEFIPVYRGALKSLNFSVALLKKGSHVYRVRTIRRGLLPSDWVVSKPVYVKGLGGR